MTKEERYERQKARQKWRYANDPEFRAKAIAYQKRYSQEIRDDPVLLEVERKRRRKYYRDNRDRLLAYQNDYVKKKRLNVNQ